MAIRFSVGFAETYFTLDGVSALHIRCESTEAASASLLYGFDVALRSTNGRYSRNFTGVQMPQGAASVSIPFVPPLEWANDFVQNLGDAAHADACGWFTVSMTVHYTLYAGSLKLENDYTGYTAALTATVKADILPSVGALAAAAVDGAVPAAWGLYVQGKSRVRITAGTAAGSYGAAIVAYTFGADGAQRAENWAELALDTAGSITVPVTVTDSRGRIATRDLLLTAAAYSAPSLTGLRSLRCDANGTANENGVCFAARFTAVGSTLEGKNPLTVTCAWKKVTDAAYGAAQVLTQDGGVLAASLEPEASYEVKYTVSDAFHTLEYRDYISSTAYLLHFLKGGTGIAVGKAAEAENLFDVGLNTSFRRDAEVGGALRVQGALMLGGTDVSEALQGLGALTGGAVALNTAAMAAASENTVLRCGRILLVRLHGTLQNDTNPNAPPYEGVRYRVGALPAGFFSAARIPLTYAYQNGRPCKAEADAAGNLYVIPAADGQTDTEVYAFGVI